MIIKEMTKAEIGRELLQQGTLLNKLAEERPHLAMAVLNGNTAFTAEGTTFALRASRAAEGARSATAGLVTRDISTAPSPDDGEPVRRDDESQAAFKQREVEWLREQYKSTPVIGAAPVTRSAAAEQRPQAKAGHAKIADRLESGDPSSALPATRATRIETQRAVSETRAHRYKLPASVAKEAPPSVHVSAQRRADTARAIGRIHGATPASIAARLGDSPKGAA